MAKKFLSVLLMLILFIAVAGCEKDKETSGNAGGSGDSKEKVTFTYFNAASPGKDGNTNETTIGKIFEDQTGVNFKTEYLVGDINTKIGTMIASGKYPDVLVPDIAIDKVLDAGAFIDLTELIEEHGPNLKKLYGPHWEQMKDKDGKINFLPFAAKHGYIKDPAIMQGAFWIQRGILKEAGYPKIKTMDEYFALIEDYQKKHPEINGASTIGFTALTYDWRFFALSNVPNHLAGYPNDGEVIVDMKTHKTNVYANDEETTGRYLKKLNELNSKGLFDKEAFVANYDEYLAKLASGRVLGFFDYGWQVQQSLDNLKTAGNDDLRYMPLPITFDGQKDQYLDPPAFINNRGVGITVSAKDPVRIIKYFDNMAKEENQKLMFWGIKDETYSVDDKGRFYQTQEQFAKTSEEKFRDESGLNTFEYYWPMGDMLYSDGNAWIPGKQPEVAQVSYTDGDKAILEAYDAKVFSDLFADPEDRPWYPTWSAVIEQGSEPQIYNQRKTDLIKEYFPKLVLAKPSEFDKVWDDYIKQFDTLNVKGFEEFMDKVVEDRIKAAGK
jgi:putative aldouronate transport system substrate-binding protein